MTETIGVGIVGTGFMGAAHALAFRAAPFVFDTRLRPSLEIIADVSLEPAEAAARRYGVKRAVASWRELVAAPEVKIVSITTPNAVHRDVAVAALRAGKHVYCEKPLAADWAAAKEMAEAARASGAHSLVGYNYLRSPAAAYARDLVAAGAIGEPAYFRGVYDEDYMADAATPFSWRCRGDIAGFGALGDLGSHLVAAAERMMGPIASVVADKRTVIAERAMPVAGDAVEKRTGGVTIAADAPKRRVENEDSAHALVAFASGAMGSLVTSRSHFGRKNHLAFEVFGSGGSVLYDQEVMNELRLFRHGAADGPQSGHTRIMIGPEHPFYGRFTPARGAGLGYNDLKVIEVAHLLEGIAGRETLFPTIADALRIERVLYAVARSAEERRWVAVEEIS
jgi:predicted dehydrogenase